MRRNQSPHSPLIWSVTILLTWASFVRVSDSRTITCNAVEKGGNAILTCDYGEKLFTDQSGKEIIIEHKFKNGSKERVLDCYWKDRASNYTCPPVPPGWTKLKVFTGVFEDMGRVLTLEFPAKKNKEGKYYCKTTGAGIISEPCSLIVTDWEPTTCKVPPVEGDENVKLTCDYGDKNSLKQFGVDHHFQNGGSERILNCSLKDGASSYTCQKKYKELEIDTTEINTGHVYVKFPASKDKDGVYYCETPGIPSEACIFSVIPETSRWVPAGKALLCVIIVCPLVLGVLVLFIRYRKKCSHYKLVVVSNATESLVSIVCSMKIMNEKLEPERVDDAHQLVTKAGPGFAAGVTADVHPVMARLWKDPKLQDFVRREAENLQLDSGAYFLNSLDRITAPDYKPTKEDVGMTRMKLADAGKTSFTFQAFHQRFLRQQTCTAEGAASDLARDTDRLLPGDHEDTVRLSSRPLEVTWTRGHKQDVEKGQQEAV